MVYNQAFKEHFIASDEQNRELYEKISAAYIDFEIVKKLVEEDSRAYFCSKLFSHSSVLKAIQIKPSFYYNYAEPTEEMTAILKKYHPEYYKKMSQPPKLVVVDDDLPF